jgi:hypothetical protein
VANYNNKETKQNPRMCILEENKICDNCCECFMCDIEPGKICDNCGKCLESTDYKSILIDDIILQND